MKRMIQSTLVIAWLGLGAVAGAQAREEQAGSVFNRLDANHDGIVSLDEYQAFSHEAKDQRKAAKLFEKIDYNRDGRISLDEWTTFISKHPHTKVDPAKL